MSCESDAHMQWASKRGHVPLLTSLWQGIARLWVIWWWWASQQLLWRGQLQCCNCRYGCPIRECGKGGPDCALSFCVNLSLVVVLWCKLLSNCTPRMTLCWLEFPTLTTQVSSTQPDKAQTWNCHDANLSLHVCSPENPILKDIHNSGFL